MRQQMIALFLFTVLLTALTSMHLFNPFMEFIEQTGVMFSDTIFLNNLILVISSELPEILGICDRIYILNEGRIVGEMDAKDTCQESIMRCIIQNSYEPAASGQ